MLLWLLRLPLSYFSSPGVRIKVSYVHFWKHLFTCFTCAQSCTFSHVYQNVHMWKQNREHVKWRMSSPVNCTFAHILTCMFTVRHMEINKHKTNEIMWNLSSHVNCTFFAHFHMNTNFLFFIFVETKQKTHKEICKFWSTCENASKFPHVETKQRTHKNLWTCWCTCAHVHKCAIHMWRHTFLDMETKQRRLQIMWNVCLDMWIAHFQMCT